MTGVLLACTRTMCFVITVLAAIITALAVARITRLITTDYLLRVPRAWLIRRWGTDSALSYWLTCPWCMSVWVAAVVSAPIWWRYELSWWWWPPTVAALSHVSGILARWDEGA